MPRKPQEKPNFILINCDDLGYGDLGCYGSKYHKTPHLDRMAAEGMRFTDFYMASSVCTPSRGAMMTGCYPRRIGFGDFDGQWVLFPGQALGLNPEEKTVAACLKEQDYATEIIGKWHCGDQPEFLPTRHGFDSYYGVPYSNDMGRQEEDSKFPPLPLLRDEGVIQEQPDQSSITERYVEEAVRFIREKKDGPFFLYFAHMYVHLPIYAPARFLRENKDPYAAAVACIDWAAGVILDELKRQGIDENTIVAFTSDNGSRCDYRESNAPLRGTKGSIWEGGFRLPFIVRWPGQVPAGTVCRNMAASMDILPTFCALAGAKIPTDRSIDGIDIRSLLMQPAADRDTVPEEHAPRDTFFYYFKNTLSAVRKNNWKLHVNRRGEKVLELYNLETDIGETTDVSDDFPDVVTELQKVLDECRRDLGDEAAGMEGSGCRPAGRVAEGRPLTEYREDHPYIIAMYDLTDRG